MKINSVQSVSPHGYFASKKQNKSGSTHISSNMSLSTADNYGRAVLNFKAGRANKIRSMVMRSPLEDKLSAFLPNLQEGELLVVSNNIKNAYKQLSENIRAIDFPIKKILHIQESRITDVLAFSLIDDYGNLKFYNVNDEPMVLKDLFCELNIESGDRQTCGWGASLNTSIGSLKIKAEPETVEARDIEDYSYMFLTEEDFENEFTLSTIQHNKRILTEEIRPKEIKKTGPTFKDVGGQDEIINQLEDELILPLFFPKIYKGVKPTRFAILHGKPGTGKTFLAEAFANEVGAKVFKTTAGRLSGSLVGESQARCNELFEKAVENQPSVIFIDEINALTKKRGGHDVHGDALLEEFLICTSEVDSRGDKVIVIGATNRLQDIDEAILRSGRFDLQLEVKEPDLKGTEDIFKLKIKEFSLDKDVDTAELAKKMFDKKLTGADITKVATKAHGYALDRTGLRAQMKAQIRAQKELSCKNDQLVLKQEDFIKAIDEFKIEDSSRNRRPIGFNTSSKK